MTVRISRRIDWIDLAKGLCIILVVMLYAVEWMEEATRQKGWTHAVADFAQPFRMPGFFLVSGLLLSRTIDRPWRVYLDGKLVHFVYFYVLWLTISMVIVGPAIGSQDGWAAVGELYAASFVRPYSLLWFIYMLPLFFIVAKLVRKWPVTLVWIAAAALQIAQVHFGTKVVEKFSHYFLFFFTGYALAPLVFRFGDAVRRHRTVAVSALLLWGVLQAYLLPAYGTHFLFSLPAGLAGAAALVAVSALMADSRVFYAIRYCGQHSLMIYLAFFIPLLGAGAALKRLYVADAGTEALILTVVSVLGALAMYWAVRGTRFRFLFERPASFRLAAPGAGGQHFSAAGLNGPRNQRA
jgi:uncharacterized membrane protein YcfT